MMARGRRISGAWPVGDNGSSPRGGALQIKKIAAYKAAPGVVLETEFLAETLTITHQSPKCTYMSYMDSDHEIR
jgi:hypothetical protein